MSNEATINKLVEMHMTPMADAFRAQLRDPSIREISFEDRFAMMVDAEYNSRKANRLKRLIMDASFDQPEAYIGDINYVSGRKLDRDLIGRLAGCEYITDNRNIFITGDNVIIGLSPSDFRKRGSHGGLVHICLRR